MADASLVAGAQTLSSRASIARLHDNASGLPRQQHTARIGSADYVRFAHPAEQHLAHLFDERGVRWQYEPTTFPLIASHAGEPIQSFTPDFYLPDHGVYLEMTTMRQSLVTRKNRKFRLMRELYPGIDVRLLYRKDVELIVDWYGGGESGTSFCEGQTVATADQIVRKVRETAAHLAGLGGPVRLVSTGMGAQWFTDAIADELASLGAALEPVGLDASGTKSCRDVLVADVVGTGLAVDAALRSARAAKTSQPSVVALLDRRSARLVDVELALPALPAPSAWIAGCGIGPVPFACRSDLVAVRRVPEIRPI